MSEPIPLNSARAGRADDNALHTPVDALRLAVADIESGECKATSVLILTLTENPTDNTYDPGWYASNLKGSQMIALMEAVKATILRDMGFT